MIDFPTHPAEVRHFVHGRIFGAIKGGLTGGFGGAVGGFLGGGGRRKQPARAVGIRRPAIQPRSRTAIIPRDVVRRPGFRAAVERAVPGGRTGLMVAGATPGGGCPQGFHPNKSDYMTTAGFVAQGSKCVRNRRRNLSNGRANTRALRRMAAWDKQERKLGKTMKAIARGR